MGYAFRFLKPHHPYLPAWIELRQRRYVCFRWLAMDLGLFVVAGVFVALAAFLSDGQPPLSPWIALARAMVSVLALVAGLAFFATGVAYLMALDHMRRAPCPRCGRPFAWSWYFSWFPSRCLHCGLEEYAPCDPAEQQWEFESQLPK